MNNKIIVIGVLCLVIGAGVGAGIVKASMGKSNTARTVSDSNSGMMHTMSNSMDGMMNGLQNKEGAEFDKAFIEEMIVHHQGAIDMAELALKNAEREEIKTLSRDIISAQNKEINQMKDWQAAWFGR